MARTPNMTQQQMDFQRGAIWAAEQLLNVPERLIHKLQGELALDDAANNSAKAEGTLKMAKEDDQIARIAAKQLTGEAQEKTAPAEDATPEQAAQVATSD